MLRWARQQGIEVGIFCALHTYGRQLNQHPHIHVSVTRGGLDVKHHVWRQLFFKKKAVEAIYRNAVVHLLRNNYAQITPGAMTGLGHIRNEDLRGTATCRPNIAVPGRTTSPKRPAAFGAA
ncbi:hypothetical protein SMQC19_46390 (plasmid) [Serratia marcescens]|nr:hypothetical protein SMQC19_46390 [Serratia marcescens]